MLGVTVRDQVGCSFSFFSFSLPIFFSFFFFLFWGGGNVVELIGLR